MQDAAATSALVELRGLSKHFGEGETRVDALRDVTLSVSAGEVVGLLGPSGSGKSTLLNVIGCIVEPNEGWLRLDGEVVYDNRWLRRDLRRLRLEKIGFIFQYHNLLRSSTAPTTSRWCFTWRAVRRTTRSGVRWACSSTCKSAIASTPCQPSSRAARRSAWRSHERSPIGHGSSSPTSRLLRSTPRGRAS